MFELQVGMSYENNYGTRVNIIDSTKIDVFECDMGERYHYDGCAFSGTTGNKLGPKHVLSISRPVGPCLSTWAMCVVYTAERIEKILHWFYREWSVFKSCTLYPWLFRVADRRVDMRDNTPIFKATHDE